LGPALGPGRELFELQEPFGSDRMPPAALAFETAPDTPFKVLLHARIVLEGRDSAAPAVTQAGRDLPQASMA